MARVEDVRFAGRSYALQLRSLDGETQLGVSSLTKPQVAPGDRVSLTFAPEGVVVYD